MTLIPPSINFLWFLPWSRAKRPSKKCLLVRSHEVAFKKKVKSQSHFTFLYKELELRFFSAPHKFDTNYYKTIVRAFFLYVFFFKMVLAKLLHIRGVGVRAVPNWHVISR